jgi:hypothetical protein
MTDRPRGRGRRGERRAGQSVTGVSSMAPFVVSPNSLYPPPFPLNAKPKPQGPTDRLVLPARLRTADPIWPRAFHDDPSNPVIPV